MTNEEFFQRLQEIERPINFNEEKMEDKRKKNLEELRNLREMLSYSFDEEKTNLERNNNLKQIHYISNLRRVK